jgi:hypothetical protein
MRRAKTLIWRGITKTIFSRMVVFIRCGFRPAGALRLLWRALLAWLFLSGRQVRSVLLASRLADGFGGNGSTRLFV